MTASRKRTAWRALSVALCYALALQAILAAVGTALAAGHAGAAGGGLAICHSDGGAAPTGDSGTADGLPCTLCAVAYASGGLVPEQDATPIVSPAIAGQVVAVEPVAFQSDTPVRAGPARAPPPPR